MAEASYSLRGSELRNFLLTGVLRVITKENWTKTAFALVTVTNDSEKRIIYRKKYTNIFASHTEKLIIAALEGNPEIQRRDKKLVEILSNYSPCSDCAREVIKFASAYPHLEITIKCAHLYNVWPLGNWKIEEASANMKGLQDLLDQEGIRIQAFSDDDWKQLLQDNGIDNSLSEALEQWYGKDRAILLEWGRHQADKTTRMALERCHSFSEIQRLYNDAVTEAERQVVK